MGEVSDNSEVDACAFFSNLEVINAIVDRFGRGLSRSSSEVDMNRCNLRASLDAFCDSAEPSGRALSKLFLLVACWTDNEDRFVEEVLVNGFDSRRGRWASKSSW